MKTNELIKLLKRNGCYITEHRASHDWWYSPITKQHFTIWRHLSKDVPTGTFNSILKAAGLK